MSFHFVFVDITCGYTADRPEADAPLGGTTSAVCFLARELAKAGHRCSLVNRIEAPAEACGIPSLPFSALSGLAADPSVSAFVFCGRWDANLVNDLRPKTRAPFIAWMHEACFEASAVPPLDAFDGAVFVSLWQMKANAPFVKLRWQQEVIRNGLHPRFANLYADKEPITPTKETPPLVVYVGDFPRGAAHLIPILEKLRAIDSNFAFEAYTDAVYTAHPDQDRATLEQLNNQPSVRHVGKVGQTVLAERMKKAAILLSPNPWPETSCLSLIQAMAAGLLCVTTDRAALRETANIYGHLIGIEDRDHLFRFDQEVDTDAFAKTVAFLLKLRREHPEAVEARLCEQRNFFVSNYRWRDRVEPWIGFVKRFA
jgi:glycosyltransferase involved in cell wall biosynthesis